MKVKGARASKQKSLKAQTELIANSIAEEISSCYQGLTRAEQSLNIGNIVYARSCFGNIRTHLQAIHAKIKELKICS